LFALDLHRFVATAHSGPLSAFGTKRTLPDVQLETAMRCKADINWRLVHDAPPARDCTLASQFFPWLTNKAVRFGVNS